MKSGQGWEENKMEQWTGVTDGQSPLNEEGAGHAIIGEGFPGQRDRENMSKGPEIGARNHKKWL